ncbi:MAG: hypothetical protein IT450_08245 [Phycisphaerales bacterium]|nr:hypothetical protein [Phycisphaerales bacterium]
MRNRLIIVAALALLVSGSAAQPIQGTIQTAGFEAKSQSGSVVRLGQWFPILGGFIAAGENFQGSFTIERPDLDGDRVTYSSGLVAVTANAAEPRRVWSYAVSNFDPNSGNLAIDIVDSRGVILPGPSALFPASLSNDWDLVLDISESAVVSLNRFDMSGAGTENLIITYGSRRTIRPICVARLPARNLPDRWFGLEAVDTLVWDEPDTDRVSAEQMAAVVRWVRNGGKLVLGIGPAWSKLIRSPLAEILPYEGDSPPAEVDRLSATGNFVRNYMKTLRPEDFDTPFIAVTAGLRSDAIAYLKDSTPEGQAINLMALRWVGSGRVTALATRIRDLDQARPSEQFYRDLIDVNAPPAKFNDKERESQNYSNPIIPMYGPFMAPIEFSRAASIRLMIAFLFVAAYIVASTIGSWVWLRRKNLTTLSWTIFAGFAVVGSALGLTAVVVVRGVLDRVASVTVLDLEAGSGETRGHVWFGYKSAQRKTVELSLPGEGNFLRPLAAAAIASYATPERYLARPAEAALADVPMRATLKQFEGFWEGKLEGSVRAGLVVDRKTGRLTEDSWIQNDLGVDISSAYLLFYDPRINLPTAGETGGVPILAAGLDSYWHKGTAFDTEKGKRDLTKDALPPAFNVLTVPLGGVKSYSKITKLGDAIYRDHDKRLADWQRGGQKTPEPLLLNLWQLHTQDWAEALRGTIITRTVADQRTAAMLLASTRGLYLQSSTDMDSVGIPIGSDGLPGLDVSHWLTRGYAVLLLTADVPGPPALHIDGEATPSDEGRTMYRVRVPIGYQ